MTRFAFGAKCGRPGSPPFADASAANAFGVTSDASAAVPMPVLARPKKCLRVRASPNSLSIRLLLRNCLVEVENRAGHRRPSGKLGRGQRGVGLRFPDSQQV